jgi:hypothetical protein
MFRLLRLIFGLSLAALPSRSSHGEPGSQAATFGAQAAKPQTKGAYHRQAVLGSNASDLVGLEAIANPGKPGVRRGARLYHVGSAGQGVPV